ncbi:MAG: hypothetical protein FJZ16_06855 [Candidatus Omnitrophica bacterium]|nr:hypothetical protein [Candidatus Omnitrophota bacterium]
MVKESANKLTYPYKIKLRIADVVIQMESRFPTQQLTKEERRVRVDERFKNFFYKGKDRPSILIKVNIVDRLPEVTDTKDIFITYHFQDGNENWRLCKKDNGYIYKSSLEGKKQLMLVNKTFDEVAAYLLPRDTIEPPRNKGQNSKNGSQGNKEFVWDVIDIIYDFLQVLLINYCAMKNEGIFTHSVGIKDLDGKGLLFTGKSGSGKSTTARIWHKQSKAMVLNDDRIIVRRRKGEFFIYGSPWHGEFSDYLVSRIDSAPLEKIFFIHHTPKNTIRQISKREAFNLLYPALFPTFWDKACLENIVSFCQDLIKNIPCYSLGFVKDKKVIKFVRRLNANIP